MSTKTAVLLVHFKDSPHTPACLDSLAAAHSPEPFDTYVLSVQCRQGDELSRHPIHPTVISETHNFGFAWANNLLIRQALEEGHDSIVLLNNDTEVSPNFLPPLLSRLHQPQVGLVCPKIYFSPGHEYHQHDYREDERGKVIWYAGGVLDWANVVGFHQGVNEVDHGQWDKTDSTDLATGCCLGISRRTLEAIGLMDERYFLYYEDADWSMKVKRRGFNLIYEPRSFIWHKNAGSTGGPGSSVHVYYQTRNRLLFGFTYAPLRTKLHLYRNALQDLHSAEPAIAAANRDALLHRFGPMAIEGS